MNKKIIIQTDGEHAEIKFTPAVKDLKYSDFLHMLSLLLTGFTSGIGHMFETMPLLRAATDFEVENDCYIFKDTKDLELYKNKMALHDYISNVIETMLTNIFVDVRVITEMKNRQQYKMDSMSDSELEQYKTLCEDIRDSVLYSEVSEPKPESVANEPTE